MLQKLGSRAQYIRITGSGRNALDFHVAFYIGEFAAKDPEAFFHVVSEDRGFEPLRAHLKERGIFVRQWKDIEEIPHVRAANAKTLPARTQLVMDYLNELGRAKPTSTKTLSARVQGMFPAGLPVSGHAGILKGLQTKGFLTVTGIKVSYPALKSVNEIGGETDASRAMAMHHLIGFTFAYASTRLVESV